MKLSDKLKAELIDLLRAYVLGGAGYKLSSKDDTIPVNSNELERYIWERCMHSYPLDEQDLLVGIEDIRYRGIKFRLVEDGAPLFEHKLTPMDIVLRIHRQEVADKQKMIAEKESVWRAMGLC